MAFFFVDVSPGGAYFKVKQVPSSENTWVSYKVISLGWGYADTPLKEVGEGEIFPKDVSLLIFHKKHKREDMKIVYEDGDYIMISPNGNIKST